MPLHLEPLDLSDTLERYGSVLIVTCPVCPPISLAADRRGPLIDLFRHGIKTPAYEHWLREIREPLERRGVRTGALTLYAPTPVMCLWTKGQRKRLQKRAKDYEAVLVAGCESARHTVEQALEGTGCDVILAMRLTGITNGTLTWRPPFTVGLENLAQVRANEAAKHDSNRTVT